MTVASRKHDERVTRSPTRFRLSRDRRRTGPAIATIGKIRARHRPRP
ncbi:hypothetical protein AZ78_1174 [Lysobacter capsici AZ78]|uniref:Uncharacterized protein n=1 Tax=Lysobacter capsici AZ78 TaxID=1444315 RepID=A0A108U6T8_9GAMM|nr:hypothetical protein AZ78_1174 [Lysobacter capsici AZ78]